MPFRVTLLVPLVTMPPAPLTTPNTVKPEPLATKLALDDTTTGPASVPAPAPSVLSTVPPFTVTRVLTTALPIRSSVPPALMTRLPEPAIAPELVRRSVPLSTVVPPVYSLGALSSSVAGPASVSEPGPVMTLAMAETPDCSVQTLAAVNRMPPFTSSVPVPMLLPNLCEPEPPLLVANRLPAPTGAFRVTAPKPEGKPLGSLADSTSAPAPRLMGALTMMSLPACSVSALKAPLIAALTLMLLVACSVTPPLASCASTAPAVMTLKPPGAAKASSGEARSSPWVPSSLMSGLVALMSRLVGSSSSVPLRPSAALRSDRPWKSR